MNYNELLTKATTLYLEGQVQSGIKAGDTVRVTGTARSFECGWSCEWAFPMSDWVNNEYVVKEVCGSRGIKLENDSGGTYNFPYWVLKKTEEFKAGQKVLVRDSTNPWRFDFFSHMSGDRFVTTGGYYAQCIPFKGNEDKVGKA